MNMVMDAFFNDLVIRNASREKKAGLIGAVKNFMSKGVMLVKPVCECECQSITQRNLKK